MTILAIETSCDETSAAVLEGNGTTVELKSNVVATSLAMHAATGGVIPENAAREQLKYILPVIKKSLIEAFDTRDASDTLDTLNQIDAFAVTYGPGLIGSLLVGVETAKTLAYLQQKPLIPVNHMLGHVYANWIEHHTIEFPVLALVVSGGHTDLLLLKKHGDFIVLGGTRDDAAGEAFDKTGRLLGLAYPAGPVIEQRAKSGDPKRFRFPRPLIGEKNYEFSFSGLKTAVLREVQKLKSAEDDAILSEQTINDLARGTQDAIIDILIKKTLRAAQEYQVKSIVLSGGVAANQTLHDTFKQMTEEKLPMTKFFAPAKNLCTDNAAMIAAAAYYQNNPVHWNDITADPELYYD